MHALQRRLASASFLLIAEVIEVGWQLADGSPRRYDALDFFHAQQFRLCLTMAIFCRKNCLDHTRVDGKKTAPQKKNGKARLQPATHLCRYKRRL